MKEIKTLLELLKLSSVYSRRCSLDIIMGKWECTTPQDKEQKQFVFLNRKLACLANNYITCLVTLDKSFLLGCIS